MKKAWLLVSLGLLVSCGGGSGIGGDTKGFYSLSLRLEQTNIISPAVSVSMPNLEGEGTPPGGGDLPNISIPPDTISGSVFLSYSGTLPNPLRGVIQKAQLCLEGLSCYTLPIGGVLTPNGSPINFTLSLNDYKFNLPWIAVNPYEDRILEEEWQEVPLPSSDTNTITYVLPSTTMVSPYVYQISGRVVEVYQEDSLLCSNTSVSSTCSVSVSGNVVRITFPGGVLPDLLLRYSQDTKVDINPSIDVNAHGRLSSATVSGHVEVEVKLESGEKLRARTPITFRVVPY